MIKSTMERLLSVIVCLILSVMVISAQTSGDKLYNQGLNLQKTMTVKSQRAAINKFSSAKKIYDSKAKKAQCDNAIQVSRNIINSLEKPDKSGKSAKNQEYEENVKRQTLELSNYNFEIDPDGNLFPVTVTSSLPEWNVNIVSNLNGESFVKVNKLDNGCFEIICPRNSTTLTRQQKIIVTAGSLKKEIFVEQKGQETILESDNKLIEFKTKGGKKTITVFCNSDERYSQNRDENWYVVSKPEWLDITIDVKKDKNLVDKTLSTVGSIFGGKKEVEKDNDKMIESKIILYALPFDSKNKGGNSIRKGEVILGSGDKSLSISVYQK